jgi:chloramphenicol-sensitive protein RarD
VAAYGLWGLMPLYFHEVQKVATALQVLAHRIVWCVLVLVVFLTVLRRWGDLWAAVRDRRTLALLLTSSVLIAINWWVYIYGVNTGRVLQTSLGYFINPLFNVVLGMVFFRERLRPCQWLAVALAAAGMLYQLRAVGELPWIALSVAGSFGLYGLIRKVTPVDGLIGLAVETAVLLPGALGCMAWWDASGTFAWSTDAWLNTLLVLSGVITAVPLLCFGQAARRLPLTTLGVIQYLAPSMQFLLGVYQFGEKFELAQQISFGLIGVALIVFTTESVWTIRRRALALRRALAAG